MVDSSNLDTVFVGVNLKLGTGQTVLVIGRSEADVNQTNVDRCINVNSSMVDNVFKPLNSTSRRGSQGRSSSTSNGDD
ncbi:hypothetical protein CDAR_284331 [Caerostris darwini]|uniref:Uncharacterized protein n=1 Tax=Caerostris darwini TaxID=1538125 RepID=A0AAV4UP45_9ARAC|nr:hypothetical protein CDAR_284331 [Caerostris darwini]